MSKRIGFAALVALAVSGVAMGQEEGGAVMTLSSGQSKVVFASGDRTDTGVAALPTLQICNDEVSASAVEIRLGRRIDSEDRYLIVPVGPGDCGFFNGEFIKLRAPGLDAGDVSVTVQVIES